MARSNLVDIDCIYVHETDKAIKVKRHETDPDPVWFPLSAVEVEGPRARGCKITLTAPEDLFLEKEMI
jgi:hypothetical protein